MKNILFILLFVVAVVLSVPTTGLAECNGNRPHIAGRIVNQAGQGVAGMDVYAYDPNDIFDDFTMTTDSEGYYAKWYITCQYFICPPPQPKSCTFYWVSPVSYDIVSPNTLGVITNHTTNQPAYNAVNFTTTY
jgi:hypothetical protein